MLSLKRPSEKRGAKKAGPFSKIWASLFVRGLLDKALGCIIGLVMRGKLLILALALLTCTLTGMELSGNFSTFFAFERPLPSAWNTLTLSFSFSGLQIQSFSIWQNLTLSRQTFIVNGTLGNFGIRTGLTLKPLSASGLNNPAAQAFQVESCFLSLEISLGQLRLTLTINTGASGP